MNSKYDKPYPNGFYNKGTGDETPITAEILNNLTAFLESIPEMEHGTTPSFRCEQQAMTITLSNCPAPIFWLTKVVTAEVNALIGMKAKPSIFMYAPFPATADAPNELTLD